MEDFPTPPFPLPIATTWPIAPLSIRCSGPPGTAGRCGLDVGRPGASGPGVAIGRSDGGSIYNGPPGGTSRGPVDTSPDGG